MEASGNIDLNGNVVVKVSPSEGQLTPAGKNLCKILFGLLDTEDTGSIEFDSCFTMVNQLSGLEACETDMTSFKEQFSKSHPSVNLEANIDLTQFEQIVKDLVMSDEVKKSAASIMHMVDKNGDGFVDQEDLQEVYELLGLPEIDSIPLIQSFDEDADGKLNAEEFGNLIADSLKMLFSKSESDIANAAENATENDLD